MKLYSQNENYKLYQGSMLDMLEVIDKESIDSIITDPPYNISQNNNFDTLKNRLREMAFLTKGLRIVLKDLREEEVIEKEFHYEGGIKEFVTYLNKNKEIILWILKNLKIMNYN